MCKENKRNHSLLLNLNEKEKRYLDNFCSHNGINNRSKFIRETLFSTIIQYSENNSPKLFK